MPAMKDVVWHHSEFQQHSVTRRITLRYCGVLRILHAVPQMSSSVLRHNTDSNQMPCRAAAVISAALKVRDSCA